MRTRSKISTPKTGITWYYEQEGSGPHVVLITDGFGECQMFDKAIGPIADCGFTVTTFDGPGMSRSGNAPPQSYQDVTSQKLAGLVIDLMDELGIEQAAFWGSSSGAAIVLALIADYPERVRNGLIHEVPTAQVGGRLAEAAKWEDETFSREISGLFINMGLVDAESWEGLGVDVHERLSKNYIRWIRGYGPLGPSIPKSPADLRRRPLNWSVGFSTPTGVFADNIVTATRMDIPFQTIPGRHFPYLSHPQEFSKYVTDICSEYVST